MFADVTWVTLEINASSTRPTLATRTIAATTESAATEHVLVTLITPELVVNSILTNFATLTLTATTPTDRATTTSAFAIQDSPATNAKMLLLA